jgi:hypothetical protein
MTDRPICTYQDRLPPDAVLHAALSANAEVQGHAERSLFAALMAGGASIPELKKKFLAKFSITARQFNAIRGGLEGKIESIKERRPQLIDDLVHRIRRAETVLKKLEKRLVDKKAAKSDLTKKDVYEQRLAIHGKKRRLANLRTKLDALKADHAAGKVRLCFGGKKLFHAQFQPEINGYLKQDEWKKGWVAARNGQVFVIGSLDETAGNQTCVAKEQTDGSLTLTLRLPDALAATHGKHVVIPNVRFGYGHAEIVAALRSSRLVKTKVVDDKGNEKTFTRRVGQPISYRFVRYDKGGRVFASVESQPVDVTTRRDCGAIGIDLNAGHLA